MIEVHEEVVILHTMASQVNHMSENYEELDGFKTEFSNMLKSLLNNQNEMLSNQNAMKQELFLLRNSKAEGVANPEPSVEKPNHDARNNVKDAKKHKTNEKEEGKESYASKASKNPKRNPPKDEKKKVVISKILTVGDLHLQS